MNDEPDIIIGERHEWDNPRTFGISAVDQRQHIYIIGKTGSGKTTLLRNMILQHIQLGHGVGLIDPHGDLAEDILDHIPRHRTDHLCYFNPSDLEFPISMNLLANVPADERHLVASGIVGAFKGIWRDSWGPRLEYILYNAISALLECQNTSLLGVNRILTDDNYRAWVIRQIKDPFIKAYWAEEYAGYDKRFRREAIFGNVGTLIAFRTGYADAEILEKEFGKAFSVGALADLDRYGAALKLLEGGTNATPFLARMLPPIERRRNGKKYIVERSRERFAAARFLVVNKLSRWTNLPCG